MEVIDENDHLYLTNDTEKKEWNKPIIKNLIGIDSTEVGGTGVGDFTTSTS